MDAMLKIVAAHSVTYWLIVILSSVVSVVTAG